MEGGGRGRPVGEPGEEVLASVWDLTQGQPWLVNALGREIVKEIGVPATAPITAAHVDRAKERLILSRATHLDSLLARLRENGDILAGRMPYPEVASQLVLMGWLHRLVNGGGFIDREVGIGRKRIDLLVRWPYTDASGRRAMQRTALELKVWRDRDKRGDPTPQGLVQLDDYLERLGLSEGVLVVFDGRAKAPPIEDRTRFEDLISASGRRVPLLRA